MKRHKIIITISIILAVFFVASLIFQNKKIKTNIPPIIEQQIVSTTTISTTTLKATTTPQIQTFPKNISLTSSKNYQFPDGTILSIKEINDSRCPANVNCIWAGNVVVSLNLTKGSNTNQDFSLTFGPGEGGTIYTYGGFNIKIIKVLPNKGSTSEVLEKKDYIFTIQVSK